MIGFQEKNILLELTIVFLIRALKKLFMIFEVEDEQIILNYTIFTSESSVIFNLIAESLGRITM